MTNLIILIKIVNNMKITRLSSTELKRNTAEVLNLVAYGEVVAIVERYGEPLVKITKATPGEKSSTLREKLKKSFGAIPNFPSLSKTRYFRKRILNL